jgi:hypothetical protein
MNHAQPTTLLADSIIDNRRLISGLRHALDVNYERVLDSARQQWERHFAGNDPSDACVRVRITSGKPTAAVIRKPKATLLYGTRRSLA